mgnify:CR=1 FL=1
MGGKQLQIHQECLKAQCTVYQQIKQIYINISCMSKKKRIKLLTIGKQMKELTQTVKL